MREIFTYGSVGRAPGNRCFYPEADPQSYAPFCACRYRSIFAQKGAPLYGPLMRGVRPSKIWIKI